MGVIFTHDITHNTGRFTIGLVVGVAAFVHGPQHAPVHRFQAIPNVRQSPADNHTHGVIEIGCPHFLFDGNGLNALRINRRWWWRSFDIGQNNVSIKIRAVIPAGFSYVFQAYFGAKRGEFPSCLHRNIQHGYKNT